MEDQDSKFVCKWCDKKYPCGKSLGGHMRSHILALSSAESEQRVVEANMKKLLSLEEQRVDNGSQSGGYGLRENPKKTFKAVDATFPMPQEKICKQCGKGFQSLKALCGHMACHSEKDRGLKDDHSWTSENPKLIMDDSEESDTEAEEEDDDAEEEEESRLLRNRSKNDKRYKRIIIKTSSMSFANNSPSSASEIDELDQEEVAICLMMLSRDSGTWGGVNSVVESSGNNSVVLETKSSSIDMRTGRKDSLQFVQSHDDEARESNKLESSKLKCSNLDAEIVELENSDSGYFLDEYVKIESDASVGGRRRNVSTFMDSSSSRPRASAGDRGEETLADIRKGFNKTKTYKSVLKKQVGRDNGNDSSSFYSKLAEYEARQKSKDSYEDMDMMNGSCRKRRHGSSDVEQSKSINKRSKYECLNCKKTFNSYQALGGHRPCHKRNNTYTESRYETAENSFDGDDSFKDIHSRNLGESLGSRKAIAKKMSYNAEKKLKSKKSKGHECPFCHRIFKNGQALGGHKRSHFLNGGGGGGMSVGVGVVEINNNPTPAFKAECPELIDLNLPAPLEDGGDDQFMPW